jgi:hypothetical protein
MMKNKKQMVFTPFVPLLVLNHSTGGDFFHEDQKRTAELLINIYNFLNLKHSVLVSKSLTGK